MEKTNELFHISLKYSNHEYNHLYQSLESCCLSLERMSRDIYFRKSSRFEHIDFSLALQELRSFVEYHRTRFPVDNTQG